MILDNPSSDRAKVNGFTKVDGPQLNKGQFGTERWPRRKWTPSFEQISTTEIEWSQLNGLQIERSKLNGQN